MTTNYDLKTVHGFGEEWTQYDQSEMPEEELKNWFSAYFKLFPFAQLTENSVGADFGCGSGRWAKLMAPKIGKLYCVDASDAALSVAKKNLANQTNVDFIHSTINGNPIPNESLDFGYSLGVLHHIPDTLSAINACVEKLKKGAPFLVYMYYAFDNKPVWFRGVWKISDCLRSIISRLPFKLKLVMSKSIAALIYYPLARTSLLLEKLNFNIKNIPLSSYRNKSFYTMSTDSLDRFGTRLEKRFTQQEIISMLQNAGLIDIKISPDFPYWCALGYKKSKKLFLNTN